MTIINLPGALTEKDAELERSKRLLFDTEAENVDRLQERSRRSVARPKR